MDTALTATIFEVREFCLHDGPGIRTTVFFKGCPLRCAWCHNPEGLSPEPEMLFKAAKCHHCGNCQNGGDCPHGARVPCGRRWTVTELAQEIRVNADILRSSGGGLTFSGGEPLMQAKFLCALVDELKNNACQALVGRARRARRGGLGEAALPPSGRAWHPQGRARPFLVTPRYCISSSLVIYSLSCDGGSLFSDEQPPRRPSGSH